MNRKIDREIHEQLFGQKTKPFKYLDGYLCDNFGKKSQRFKPEYAFEIACENEDAEGYLYHQIEDDGSYSVRLNIIPEYTTLRDIDLVIIRMRELGWRVLDITEMENGKWTAAFWKSNGSKRTKVKSEQKKSKLTEKVEIPKGLKMRHAIADSMPEAICRAALSSIKVKTKKGKKK